jgi:hypothetical protein
MWRGGKLYSLIKEFSSSSSSSSSSSGDGEGGGEGGGGGGEVVCVDLEQDMPYLTPAGHRDEQLWDDALHMTPAGYDRLGGLVFTALEGRLQRMLL